jgi:HAD superfamily hydrolase (TIGR01549 family)
MLVVFDFDGPLFKSRAPRNRALAATIEHYAAAFGTPNCNASELPLYEPVRTIRLVYAELPLTLTELAEIEQFYRDRLIQEEASEDVLASVRGAVQSLNRLNCRLAVLSMRSERKLREILRKFRLSNFFQEIRGRDTPPYSKPDPRVLFHLLETAKVSLDAAIFVGDTHADLMIARQVGVTYFHACWTGEPIDISLLKPTECLTAPEDLLSIVQYSTDQLENRQETRLRLIDVARQGCFSFFAGAGVSIPSGFGDWENEYRPIVTRHCPAPLLAGRSLAELVQLAAAREDSARAIFDSFKTTFAGKKVTPNAYHLAMVRSECQTIWTTNYDDLFERAQVFTGQQMGVVKNDARLKEFFGRGRLLIKINGDFEVANYDPKSLSWGIVLCDEQFDLAEHERAELWRYFEDEYRTSTLVFVGVSFTDPTLKRVLSIVSRKLMRTRNPHFVLVVVPTDPIERFAMARGAEMLRKRDIHTIPFDNYDQLNKFVLRICLLSVKPVVAFSGISHPEANRSDAVPAVGPDEHLPNGELTVGDIAWVCGEMGRRLAAAGLRIISGHGQGVGVPAVVEAFRENRHAARFYMRSQGQGAVSRQAPAIYVEGDDLGKLRSRFVSSCVMVIAAGGTGSNWRDSGTVEEVRLAVKRGLPVLLLRQGGGNVFQMANELNAVLQADIADVAFREAVMTANDELWRVPGPAMGEFLDKRFINLITELLSRMMSSPLARGFDDGLANAAEDWL